MSELLDSSRYAKRGGSSSKEEVHAAVEVLDKGLYPGAFCKIFPDIFTNNPDYCLIQHADSAGTKAALAYLAWKYLGDLSVWEGIALDSLIMNFDYMACAGSLGPFLVSMTLSRNKHLIPGEVISALIQKCQHYCDWLSSINIPCLYSGGETEDIGDLVRTITVNSTITTRFPRFDVIDASQIRAPAFIVGFSSTGQASWENEPNSGMISNDLTNSRHDVLSPQYRKDTETFAPETPADFIYCGDHALTDKLPGDERFTIASAMLSPTRTYLPLINKLFYLLGYRRIKALIHCSGGGQTKIGNFGPLGVRYRKNDLLPIPPLFQMLQKVRKLPWYEMFKSYNMGHGLEAVVETHQTTDECIKIARSCGIEAKVIGEVIPFENPHARQVQIVTSEGTFEYSFAT